MLLELRKVMCDCAILEVIFSSLLVTCDSIFLQSNFRSLDGEMCIGASDLHLWPIANNSTPATWLVSEVKIAGVVFG